MASALLARGAEAPRGAPVLVAQGPAGPANVGAEVMPRTCYLALATMTRSAPRGIGLHVRVAARTVEDERGLAGGAAVAFCTGSESRVRIDIEARGQGWVLAIFRASGGAEPSAPRDRRTAAMDDVREGR
jgi:hypothetical protein